MNGLPQILTQRTSVLGWSCIHNKGKLLSMFTIEGPSALLYKPKASSGWAEVEDFCPCLWCCKRTLPLHQLLSSSTARWGIQW